MLTRDRNIIVELEDGSKVGFRIDNWALKESQNKSGCKGMIEFLYRLGLDTGNVDLQLLTIFIMETANEYNHFMKKGERPIDERTASHYIDQLGGPVDALGKLAEAFQQYVPKNSQPPRKKRGKEKILQ